LRCSTEAATSIMLAAIAVVLVVLWVLGFATAHLFGGMLHLLLAIALIALIVHFVQGRGRRGSTRAPF
jgi:hypothetical protein